MCNSGNDALLPTSSHLSSPRTGLCVIFCVCVMHEGKLRRYNNDKR